MSGVDLILARASEREWPVRVIGVDGPAGAGKTTLAERLARELRRRTGQRPPVVHMDDLYPGWDGLAVAPSLLVEHVLAPLTRGENGRFRRWDWHRGERAEEVVVPASAWVVVEGVGCGSRICRPHLAVLAWIEVDEPTRMRRALERDGEAFAPHWERWARQEERLFASQDTRGAAGVLVGG